MLLCAAGLFCAFCKLSVLKPVDEIAARGQVVRTPASLHRTPDQWKEVLQDLGEHHDRWVRYVQAPSALAHKMGTRGYAGEAPSHSPKMPNGPMNAVRGG